MESQITIRIPAELRRALEVASRKMNLRSSEIVRRALRDYLGAPDRRDARPAARVQDLLGSLDSGTPDLAENAREYLIERLRGGK